MPICHPSACSKDSHKYPNLEIKIGITDTPYVHYNNISIRQQLLWFEIQFPNLLQKCRNTDTPKPIKSFKNRVQEGDKRIL